MPFGGETYDRTRDRARLQRQLDKVRRLMMDGEWWTLGALEEQTGAPQASISARVRDLRKPKFGGYDVPKRYVSDGLWEYRVVLPTGQMELLAS